MSMNRTFYSKTALLTIIYITIVLLLWYGGLHIQFDDYAPLASIPNRLIAISVVTLLWGAANFRLGLIHARSSSDQSHEKRRLKRYYRRIFRQHRLLDKNLNWYWFVGPASGLSTLFTRWDAQSILDSTHPIQIWHTDNALLFESHVHDNGQAKQHIEALSGLRRQNPVDHIFIGLPTQTVLDGYWSQTMAATMEALQPYNRYVTCLITQCDQIPGFNAFYDTLNEYRTNQPFGFSINEGEQWQSRFQVQFKQWLDNIENQILHSLHYEYSEHKRRLIAEFGEQIGCYKEPLQHFCRHFQKQSATRIIQIYWLSTIRGSDQRDVIGKALQKHVLLKPQPANVLDPVPQKAFIHNLLPVKAATKPNQGNSLATNTLGVSLLTVAAASVGFNVWVMATGDTRIPSYRQVVNQYWEQPEINQKAHVDSIKDKLINRLEREQGKALYTDLKVYLMLTDKLKRDHPFLYDRLVEFNASPQPGALHKWLRRSGRLIPYDAELVQKVRNKLSTKQVTNRIHQQLDRLYTGHITVLPANNTLNGQAVTVPKAYSRQSFHAVWERFLPHQCRDMANVLGLSKDQYAHWLDTLRQQYLKHYRQHWQKALDPVELPTDLSRLDNSQRVFEAAELLPSVLDTIKQHIDIAHTPQMFDVEVKQQFEQLNRLSGQQIQDLHSSFVHLKKRQQQWHNNQGLDQGAFQWAFERFQHAKDDDWTDQLADIAQALPQPLSDSVLRFSNQYRQLLLKASARYIQQQWRQQVYRPYQQQVAPYYPFNPEAGVDLDLADLKRFFGNDGVFVSFYQDYLRPFVNTEGSHWQLKTVNGDKLALTDADFSDAMQAFVIHRMFFDSDYSEPHVPFTLIPTALAPQTSEVDITINGQHMHLAQGEMAMQDFTWPGEQNESLTKVTFTAKQGGQSEETKSGVWGLFKLLDEMQLEQTDNPARFKLVLDLNGQAVRMRLLAGHRVNPFLMDLVHGFSPQEQL